MGQRRINRPLHGHHFFAIALPTIFSSIFANLYSTVDGVFVARFVDTDALSAINITMPMTYLASALGMMFGTGGNALVARKIGEGKYQEAREDFSLLMAVAFVFSVVLSILCFLFLNPLCRFLGSDDALLPGEYDSGAGVADAVWNGWRVAVHHRRRGAEPCHEHLLLCEIQGYVESTASVMPSTYL